MTKSELIKSLDGIGDDSVIKVQVTIYNNVCQDMVQTKTFDDVFVHGAVIGVQCPDDDEWEEV